VGGELAAGGAARFQLVVEGAPRDLCPTVGDEIYRIGAEALRNAFSHARANSIEVHIRCSDQLLQLQIRQEREFERVGGTQAIPVDVRVIAATNCDLSAAVRSGKFRMDLFYRLNVVPIHAPPLRERREDILLLAKYFIHQYAAKFGKKIRRVDRRTAQILEA
jgi:hypothetical protein